MKFFCLKFFESSLKPHRLGNFTEGENNEGNETSPRLKAAQDAIKAMRNQKDTEGPLSPEDANRKVEEMPNEAISTAGKIMKVDGGNFENEMKNNDNPPPDPMDPELKDLAGELEPEARIVLEKKLKTFIQEQLNKLKELGGLKGMMEGLEEMGQPLSHEERMHLEKTFNEFENLGENDWDKAINNFLKVLTPEEIQAINENPNGFEFNNEFFIRLAEANKDSVTPKKEEEKEGNEGPTEEEKEGNEKAIAESIQNLKPEDLIPEGEEGNPIAQATAEAYLDYIQSPQNMAVMKTFAQNFNEAGLEAAIASLKSTYSLFVANLDQGEIKDGIPKITPEQLSFIGKNLGEEGAAAKKKGKEGAEAVSSLKEAQSNFQGAIEAFTKLIEIFKSAAEAFQKGDATTAASLIRLYFEGKDAGEEQDMDKALLSSRLSEQNSNAPSLDQLFAFYKDPQAEVNKIYFGVDESGRIPNSFPTQEKEVAFAEIASRLRLREGELTKIEISEAGGGEIIISFGNYEAIISGPPGDQTLAVNGESSNGEKIPIMLRDKATQTTPEGETIISFVSTPTVHIGEGEDLTKVLRDQFEFLPKNVPTPAAKENPAELTA